VVKYNSLNHKVQHKVKPSRNNQSNYF